jgi:hypothetical protein
MKNIILSTCLIFFTTEILTAQENDSPEMLTWVQDMSGKIEKRLQGALAIQEWGQLLIVLMEVKSDFETIGLTGIQCPGVRVAAEEGRAYANWLNHEKDKGLTACVIRAQEARKSAARMADAALRCQKSMAEDTTKKGRMLTPVLVITEEVSVIEQTLHEALTAPNTHLRLLKLEIAYQLFNDADRLTRSLVKCEDAHYDASDGAHACLLALTAAEQAAMTGHIQEAMAAAKKLNIHVLKCR